MIQTQPENLSKEKEEDTIKHQLVAAVCALEACSYEIQRELMGYDAAALARVFFSGTYN